LKAQELTNNQENPISILQQYWGYASFRGEQEKVIASILAKKRTLALLPTGGGKSICFQVPALMQPGCCLVISPLIALMKDQVENLLQKGISAAAIVSGMKQREIMQVLQDVGRGRIRFLYVSPERLESRLFLEHVDMLSISLVAIDEAHCISQWGFDFRPPYRRIPDFLALLSPDTPVLALTASATPDVQQDICNLLAIDRAHVFQQSFLRPALSYTCRIVEAKMPALIQILSATTGSSIVYCKSRSRTQRIANELSQVGINATWYHAGISSVERSQKQESWIQNEVRVMVCTNAFGMGIDKPDVRLVVHFDIPDCLEHYYQEAGRAGRDGMKAYAVALYQQEDIHQLRRQSEIRFPTQDYIQSVYQAVANYLQLPAGMGNGQFFSFDLHECCQNFKLEPLAALHALKWLEIAGYLRFNEQVFIPAQVQFTCNRQQLQVIEDQEPALDELIKVLLRNYEGIFDSPVSIHEKNLAYLIPQSLDWVIQHLQLLHRRGIIAYKPLLDSPQVQFLYPRISSHEIRINEKLKQERQDSFNQKLNQFIAFLTNTKTCRSVMIGQYFGDPDIQPCGICDTCIQLAKSNVGRHASFADLLQAILVMLHEPTMDVKGVQKAFPLEDPALVIRALHWLENEGAIQINPQGLITRKKN
jgi:ATP-dependent DNA helicase RecQ